MYTNPANGGTPTRDALNYIGQQYMRTDASAPIQYACQRNAAFILTDGFANASGPTVPTYTKTTWGNGAPFTTIYANTLADICAVLLHHQPAARPCRPDWCRSTRPTRGRTPIAIRICT